MNVLRAIENIRKDVLNFEEMFIESDMPDCFSRIYESENPTVSARELHEKLNIKTAFKDWFLSLAPCYIAVWLSCTAFSATFCVSSHISGTSKTGSDNILLASKYVPL